MPETVRSVNKQLTNELVASELVAKLKAGALRKDCWLQGTYTVKEIAQDQYTIVIGGGDEAGVYNSLKLDFKDAQSDAARDASSESVPFNWGKAEHGSLFAPAWAKWITNQGLGMSFPFDFSSQSAELEPDDQLGVADDIAEDWTSDRLTDELLTLDAETDWPRLRELVVTAEDFDFTPDQSAQLSPRLLDFAIQHRDSNDSQDAPVVFSAIRTGASMLFPTEASCLLALLKPGHSIDTSLVTLKMLGRIFEAQPPEKPDQHTDLAGEVHRIADLLLNPYAIAFSKSAAMAQLAVYALAAMASSEIFATVQAVQRIGVSWFTRQTAHGLRELRGYWDERATPVAPEVLELLDHATQALQTT